MRRHSLAGQAIEVGWVRNNTCDPAEEDYYRMGLKEPSRCTCIHPCRVGSPVAEVKHETTARFERYGCRLGAAFGSRTTCST